MKAMSRQQIVILLVAGLQMIFLGGCVKDKNHSIELNKQIAQLHRELDVSQQNNKDLTQSLGRQQKQIQTLQQLGDKRIEELYYVSQIKLGRYTGPVDFDGIEGVDGIKVYLSPIDRSGDTLKAAGRAKVQIYDLALKPGKNLIAEKTWSPKELANMFSGGFMTYHYTLQCPWNEPPKNPEVTVRVEFIDYLTGKSFTAQKVCKVPVTPDKKETSKDQK